MNLKGAHVFQAEAIRRASKISAELRDGVDVGSLCRRRQIADRHVLDHATTQRAHLGHLETSCLRGGLQHPRSFQTGGRLTTRLPLPRKRVRSIPNRFCLKSSRSREASMTQARAYSSDVAFSPSV